MTTDRTLDDLLHSLDLIGEHAQEERLLLSTYMLNRVDTLAASRSLTRLESLGLLQRSEQRRGPGVYYTVAAGYQEPTPQVTLQVTPKTKSELLAILAEGGRLAKTDTENLILLLCTEAPRTARELADILHRNVDYVRNVYLSAMVKNKKLELTGPANAPSLAYRAVSGERQSNGN